MTKSQQLADKMRDVSVFCIANKGRCFEGWTGRKVFAYLTFHALSGTLFVLRKSQQIVAVAVAWTGDKREFMEREAAKIPQFAWKLPPKGDCLLIGQVFGKRSFCGELWQMALKQWPNVKSALAYRRKPGTPIARPELVEISHSTMRRFYRLA